MKTNPLRDATASPTPDAMRHALSAFPTGIAVVAAQVQGRTVGLLASSFSSVSLDPPLVSLAFARTSTTWPVLRQADRWGISVLGDGAAMPGGSWGPPTRSRMPAPSARPPATPPSRRVGTPTR